MPLVTGNAGGQVENSSCYCNEETNSFFISLWQAILLIKEYDFLDVMIFCLLCLLGVQFCLCVNIFF